MAYILSGALGLSQNDILLLKIPKIKGILRVSYLAGPLPTYIKTRSPLERSISFSHQYSSHTSVKLIVNHTTRDVIVNTNSLLGVG